MEKWSAGILEYWISGFFSIIHFCINPTFHLHSNLVLAFQGKEPRAINDRK